LSIAGIDIKILKERQRETQRGHDYIFLPAASAKSRSLFPLFKINGSKCSNSLFTAFRIIYKLVIDETILLPEKQMNYR